MYKLSIHSPTGNLILSGNPNYHITHISGLTPVRATINSSAIAGGDGAAFNSASAGTRNIVMTILPNHPVAANRQMLYRVMPVKSPVTVRFSAEGRDVQIDGYVEYIDGDLFANRQALQVSIICMQPYFKSAQEIVDTLSSIIDMFEFPFSIEEEGIPFSELSLDARIIVTNGGETPCGAVFHISAMGAVENPVIYNADDTTRYALNVSMQTGDEIIIDTRRGSKSAVLIRQGKRTNIINNRASDITWFQLPVGDSTFTYSAESGVGNMALVIEHNDMFGGV